MCHFLKPQAIGNLRNIPGSLFKQDLGFLYYPVADMLGSGFARIFFEYFIKVIDVDR